MLQPIELTHFCVFEPDFWAEIFFAGNSMLLIDRALKGEYFLLPSFSNLMTSI